MIAINLLLTGLVIFQIYQNEKLSKASKVALKLEQKFKEQQKEVKLLENEELKNSKLLESNLNKLNYLNTLESGVLHRIADYIELEELENLLHRKTQLELTIAKELKVA